MIYDTLDRIGLYAPLSPTLARAIDWLGRTDLAAWPADGQRRSVIGDDVAAIVSRYVTWLPDAYVWESHRRFIDIQIVLEGREQIGVAPLSRGLQVTEPYDPAKDAQFYARDTEPAATLQMTPGVFAVLFPQDAHGPNQAWRGCPAPVTKLVVKVRAGPHSDVDGG